MLRVLIVDDEQYIRKGLEEHVDWQGHGCEVVGLAGDGEEALEIVEAKHPHIIITDIKMPFMNGLELVEKVKEKYPETYIILISGHDEFTYVQKAIKLGADDYMLKPIDIDYVGDYLDKVKAEVKQTIKEEARLNDLIEIVDESTPVIKGKILKEIVLNRISVSEAMEKLEKYGVTSVNDYSVVLIAHADEKDTLDESGLSYDENDLENIYYDSFKHWINTAKDITLFEESHREVVMCITATQKVQLRRRIEEVSNILKEHAATEKNQTVTIAVGEIVDSLKEIAVSYKNAYEAMAYKFILGNDTVIHHKDLDKINRSEVSEKYIDFDDAELIASIKFSDKELIKKNLNDLAGRIRGKGKDSYIFTNLIIGSIYRHALQILENEGGTIEDIFDDPMEVFNAIISKETIDGMVEALLDTLYTIADYIGKNMMGKSVQIEKAKDYIMDHYEDSDICLDVVAQNVNMSTSYFSNIFKQETEQTFVDFLTKVRMEKAKDFLMKGYKSYEVSYMVGYNNPTYFSTVFKRSIGVTPTQYFLKYR